MIGHRLALTGAITVLMVGAIACGPGAPLAGGPGPLPERAGPLLNNRGNELFAQSDYDAALEEYLSAREEVPDKQEPLLNAGNAHYRKGALEDAENHYQETLEQPERTLDEETDYNLGNTYFKAQQFAKAIESYKAALRLDPDDMDAKHNLELALSQMQDQQQKQPEPQDSEKAQEGEEDKDQAKGSQEGAGNPSDQPPNPAGEGQPEGPQESNPDNPQPGAVTELSEGQARQLLEALGDSTETLQRSVQQTVIAQGEPPEKDW